MTLAPHDQTLRYIEGHAYRHFPIDLFLSHNHNDASLVLAEKLSALGLNVWYDSFADLTDGRVATVVSVALKSARFVALCVGAGYRDSEWCRSEYLPALELQQKLGIDRMVLVHLDRHALTPAHLESCRSFEMDAPGLNRLVSFVKAANFVDYRRPAMRGDDAVGRRHMKLQSLVSRIHLGTLLGEQNLLAAEMLGSLVKKEYTYLEGLTLMQLRMQLCSLPFSDDAVCGQLLAATNVLARHAFLIAPDADVRANAFLLATWAAVSHPCIRSMRNFSVLLRREGSREVIANAIHFAASLTDPDEKERTDSVRPVAEPVSANNDTEETTVGGKLLRKLRLLEEVDKLKSALDASPVVKDLSPFERAHLLYEQLRDACRCELQGPAISRRDWQDDSSLVTASLFGIPSIELVLRGFVSLLLGRHHNLLAPRELGSRREEIVRTIIDALTYLVDTSEQNEGRPLVLGYEYYCDTMLLILAHGILRHDDLSAKALSLGRRCHEQFRLFAPATFRWEPDVYDRYLDDLACGMDIRKANQAFGAAMLQGAKAAPFS